MSPSTIEAQCALVNGASRGLGLEFVRQLLAAGLPHVVASCRQPATASDLRQLAGPDRLSILALDVSAEASVEQAARTFEALGRPLDLLINTAGLLHDADQPVPERRLADIDALAMQRSYAVNALGPLLIAKHFQRFLPARRRCVIVNLSARVGSIGDNRLGGWYAYRLSKAAQNMATRNLAIELKRRYRKVICVALHPGTVDTELSRPFQHNLPAGQVQPVALAVQRMLQVITDLDTSSNGRFLAFDGEELPW